MQIKSPLVVASAYKGARGAPCGGDRGQALILRWPLVRTLSCACPPASKLKTANVALFFFSLPPPPPLPRPDLFFFFLFFFFVSQCRIQGQCPKQVPLGPTSDGDSSPTACVSKNSELTPVSGRPAPGAAARAGSCGRLFVPRPAACQRGTPFSRARIVRLFT